MFKRSRRRRRRRSEMRLGAKSLDFKTKSSRSGLSITPLLKFWWVYGARISGVALLALLIWSIYVLFTTSIFFVYGADIKGNMAVTSQEIYAASGIDSQSVFWISSAKIADRIVTLPNIKSAAVTVSLPAKVTIKVVERQPELLWQTGDTVWWVDQEGTIVPPKEEVEGMLRIIDDDRQPLEPGHQIDLNIVRGARRLRLFAPEVSLIRYSRANGLTVATPEGWPVFLGDGDEMRAKLVVLTSVLADLEERNITPQYIDMRNPLRPVFQPRSLIRIGEPVSTGPARSAEPRPAPNAPSDD
jgi:cell division protein FtsQ